MSERPLPSDATLLDAINAIENSRRRIAVVVDEERRVVGTLTDGDIRRALLKRGSLESPAAAAMNVAPVILRRPWREEDVLAVFQARNILSAPVVDANGRFERILHLNDLGLPDAAVEEESPIGTAIIMAGGEGKRLRPLTEKLPKPMVRVGEVPVLERQIVNLRNGGIRRILISVNYLGGIIEDHFGDGSKLGVEISYLREAKPLGTGGPLSLARGEVADFVVSNGDLVTACDYRSLARFHVESDAALTVVAIEHRVQIPFGVLRTNEGGRVAGIEEKPSERFLCNAGIYIVSPAAAALVPSDEFFNMTDLVKSCIGHGLTVAVYPMHEFWSDIGTLDELERVRAMFGHRSDESARDA